MMHTDSEKLKLLLNGQLSAEESTRILEHIAECDECAERMALITLELPTVAPPEGLYEEVLSAAAKEKSREKRKSENLLMYSIRVTAGICAALVMLFTGAFESVMKLGEIDMSKVTDKEHSITRTIDEGFDGFKQKISEFKFEIKTGGNNNAEKE